VTTLTKRSQKPKAWTDGIPVEPVCRITVEQYHEMIQAGILGPDDPIELLEGWLVRKIAKDPPHVTANELLRDELSQMLPRGWSVRMQNPVTLPDSEPEPDLAVVRGTHRDYLGSHPMPDDIALVVEVAESSLQRDKGLKKTIYARAGAEQYWVFNLPDSTIEVFSVPTGSTKHPDYRKHQVFTAKQKVPVVLKGKKVESLLVADVLP